ncbi:MAG: hypothetical protein KDF24_06110 [Rhodocyclaceae bacterium]|nr:hypothetical protein [Rhodocyclaceae bacterium]MCB1962725.1 hypothetical protein [Rhodocyclaceae bacterium]
MKIKTALAAALFAASSSAWAYHCPVDMKKIDEAMAKHPQLSTEQSAQIAAWRAEGEALHKAGKHQESVDTLAKALKALGL